MNEIIISRNKKDVTVERTVSDVNINVVRKDVSMSFERAITNPAYGEHLSNTDIHVTQANKAYWNSKQDSEINISLVEIFEGELA